jgi:uncharacterized protein YutE (UPF0331/DUF86 family)
MPDKNIVLGKVANIQRCLQRIREVTNLDPQTLDGFNVQDIFVLNLQRAVQSTIDLAAHVVSSEGLGLPANMKEHFLMLQRAGVISEFLANKMTSMVGFRNIAIHDYESIDPDILKSILKTNLPDLEEFYTTILKRYNIV